MAIVAFFCNNVQAYAYYPGLKQSFFGKFETLNRLAFAISALVIRSGFWNFWFVMSVPDVLKAAQSGIHWQMVVSALAWIFTTMAHFKQFPPVANGLLGFVTGKNKAPVVPSVDGIGFAGDQKKAAAKKKKK